MRASVILCAVAVGFSFQSSVPPCAAVERFSEFLEGLRQRGLDELTLDYLQRAEQSPLISQELRQSIEYERGISLLDLAARTEGSERREAMLQQAERSLESFVESHPEDPLAARGRSRLARELIERGRALVARSQLPKSAGDRPALLGEARGLYERSGKLLETNDAYYVKMLEAFPKLLDPRKEAARIEQRSRLRGELLSTRLLAATVVHDTGRTFPAGTEAYKKALQDAAGRYRELYEKYRRYLAGLYARLGEGRCYQDLGQWDEAIGCYDDVASQPAEEPAFRPLAVEAVARQIECLVEQKKYDEAIARGSAWLAKIRAAEQADAHWLELKYELAVAHQQKAEGLEDGDAQRHRHLRDARSLVRDVARNPGQYREPARVLAVSLGQQQRSQQPGDFSSALAAAQEELDQMRSAKVGVQLAKKNNQASLGELEAQLSDHRDAAMQYLRLALQLADEKTPIDSLNQARYYLSYLEWEQGRYYDAAVLGEFLAVRYPSSSVSQHAARIALAAYQKLGAQNDAADDPFSQRHVQRLADRIARQWPDQPISDDAYSLLARFAVRSDRWEKALEYVERISAQRRAEPRLRVGLALWARYLNQLRVAKPPGPSNPEDLGRLKQSAREALERGLEERRDGNPIDQTVAMSALALAQIALDSGNFSQAVSILEGKPYGPLLLVNTSHPAVADQEEFAEETYKAAMQAYLSVRPAAVQKALQVVAALEQSVEGKDDPRAQQKLQRIYLGLSGQLKAQCEKSLRAGRHEQLQALSQAFDALLARAAQHSGSTDWKTSYWIAETYSQLGDALRAVPGSQQQAATYYQQAIAAYDRTLAMQPTDPPADSSGQAALGIMLRKAQCLRHVGRYREALDQLAAILASKPNMLDAQLAAAYTYQQRAAAEDPKWYPRAWQGGRKNPKTQTNLVWGWSKLAQITARYAQYRDVFFESRYNLALCRFRYALEKKDTDRAKYLQLAKSDIRFTVEFYPELASNPWREKYDQLLRSIEKELGESPQGLEQFDLSAKGQRSDLEGASMR